MTITSFALTVPGVVGVGPAVSVASLAAANRTITFNTDTTYDSTFQIEISEDNTTWVPLPGATFVSSDARTLDFSALWVRVNRVKGAGGTQVCRIGGEIAAATWNPAQLYKATSDSAAGAALAEVPFFRCSGARSIKDIGFIPGAGLGGDPANNATLTVRAYNSAGTLIGVVASLATTASWTAKQIQALAAGAVTALTDGDFLTFEISKNGTGVTVGPGVLVVRFD